MTKEVTLKDVREAYERIKPHTKYTPVDLTDNISKNVKCNVWLKMDMLQRCRAFKFRGALSKISTLPKGSTICCASAGNHSQGCALSAQLMGIKCIVFMPETAPKAKVIATRNYGAEVRQFGQTFDEANAKCKEFVSQNSDVIFVPPFDDENVIAGQGTIALEINEQIKEIDTVVVAVGGGGLASGVGLAIKSLRPNVRVIAVNAAKAANTYIKYQRAKGREIDPNALSEPKNDRKPLADGINVVIPGTMTFPYVLKYVDEFVVVTEHEIACAIALLAERAKVCVEGAGASTLAALLFNKFEHKMNENVVCILSGGNIPLSRLTECFVEAKDYLAEH
ncbi:MAG: threonine/serine dehydratase [Clostridia bacterium]|nr:threonine/serine dehydratase [Clostridia bacterium]